MLHKYLFLEQYKKNVETSPARTKNLGHISVMKVGGRSEEASSNNIY